MIFSNLSDERVADFLGLFPAPFHAIVFRSTQQQADVSAAEVMTAHPRARRIAMVTRGQPVVYGRLAFELVRLAERRGLPCVVCSSTSIFDNFPPLVEDAAGPALQVRDAKDVRDVDPARPLVVYLPRSGRPGMLGALGKLYPRRHGVHLLPGSGEREFEPARLRFSELSGALDRGDPACTLLVPPLSR